MISKESKRDQNKARKKAALIDAAETLFVRNGFDSTSIDDVAKEAGLTKRTLYQYFTSKEDLFFAVALKGARLLTDLYEDGLARGDTALDKIRLANQVYFRFYTEHFGMFKLLNYQPANQQNCAASPHCLELAVLSGVRIKHYVNLVEMAMKDGSINGQLDIRKAVFFSFFAAYSMMYTVSSMDAGMWNIMGLEENDFLRFSIDLLADALK